MAFIIELNKLILKFQKKKKKKESKTFSWASKSAVASRLCLLGPHFKRKILKKTCFYEET